MWQSAGLTQPGKGGDIHKWGCVYEHVQEDRQFARHPLLKQCCQIIQVWGC